MRRGLLPIRCEQDIAKKLLAIILLESTTVQDVLSLFLDQRYAALQQLLEDGFERSCPASAIRSAHSDNVAPPAGTTLNGRGSRRHRGDRGHSRKGSPKLNAAAVLRELSPAPNAIGQDSAIDAIATGPAKNR